MKKFLCEGTVSFSLIFRNAPDWEENHKKHKGHKEGLNPLCDLCALCGFLPLS